ncbi:hypothetical protein ACHABX_02635 [Nesterenkonia halotolerans]|uniref:hypothetical protein n=1 Tax=Nesterenkonia halotolerans TaxID=225325 RepID=UPI003EE54DF0
MDPETIAASASTIAAGIAAVGLILSRVKALAAELGAVRHQVQNDHGTNLRDDIDRAYTESLQAHRETTAALLKVHDRLTVSDERQISTIRRLDRLEMKVSPTR